MTFYDTFHLAETKLGLGVCLHPIQILEISPVEVLAPFESEDDASEFVKAIIETQNEIIQKLQDEQEKRNAIQSER